MIGAKITGLAVVSVCGNTSKEDLFNACVNLKSPGTENGLFKISEDNFAKIKSSQTFTVVDGDSRCMILSTIALRAALADSEWLDADMTDTGFIFASTTSQIDLWENSLKSIQHQSLAAPVELLTNKFKIFGPKMHVASSCSASLQAIALAGQWIHSKKISRCIVGGTEIHSHLTTAGFASLRLLSTSIATPFALNRKGINLGEGSAFMCLEAANLRQNKKHWGYVLGSGYGADAYHATAPHPQGLGSQQAVGQALKKSTLKAEKIDWIYSHGTGSVANDFCEAIALEKIFPLSVPVTSTKPIHGHTLAASGILESALGLMAMKESIILPTAGLINKDPQINLNIPTEKTSKKINYFLKNSLGFGGINTAIVFGNTLP